MLGNSKFNDYYDANMDQWGVMDDPKTRKTGLRNPLSKWKEIKRYDYNPNLDSIGHEMQVECMYLMNSKLKMDEKAYHFARRACGSEPKGNGERQKMRKDATTIAKIAGVITCNWRGIHLETIPQFNYKHTRDMKNDGLVTVAGQSAPADKPQTDWTVGTEIEKASGTTCRSRATRTTSPGWASVSRKTYTSTTSMRCSTVSAASNKHTIEITKAFHNGRPFSYSLWRCTDRQFFTSLLARNSCFAMGSAFPRPKTGNRK
ncbi:MAG: hypothetical protein IIV27_03270 [Clostridia bacterium]|nr:hypothetical protein [Clostridia bacterium]